MYRTLDGFQKLPLHILFDNIPVRSKRTVTFHKVLNLLLQIHPYGAFTNIRQDKWIYIFDDHDGDDDEEEDRDRNDIDNDNEDDETDYGRDYEIVDDDDQHLHDYYTQDNQDDNSTHVDDEDDVIMVLNSNNNYGAIYDEDITHRVNDNDDDDDDGTANGNIIPLTISRSMDDLHMIDELAIDLDAIEVVEHVVSMEEEVEVDTELQARISSSSRGSTVYASYDYIDTEFEDTEYDEDASSSSSPSSSSSSSLPPISPQHRNLTLYPQQLNIQQQPQNNSSINNIINISISITDTIDNDEVRALPFAYNLYNRYHHHQNYFL